MRNLVISVVILLAISCSAPQRDAKVDGAPDESVILAGHSSHGEAFNEGPRQAAYLIPGTGDVQWPVTTANADAQAFFNQGLGQLYGFWYFEAERSFRQVALLDPNCAMAYWGMALANIKNDKRAREFCEKAMALRAPAKDQERRHIEAISEFYQSTGKKSEREKRYVAALKDISTEYPDDIETRALLVRYRWEYRAALKTKIEDQEADEKIIQGILEKRPNHPAHHFRIHLWDDKNVDRALASAAQCGQSAPGIAHMWHMPGHTYSRLKRFDDAAWHQEASARVDHAHMQRDRIMPDQIHNYAHNNEWLCRDLMAIGRVHDAISLAENMRSLPRHPLFNTPKKGSGDYGTKRLFDIFYQYEMWDRLLLLSEDLLAEETVDSNHYASAQSAKGLALFMLGKKAEAQAQRKVIGDLLATKKQQQGEASAKTKRQDVVDQKSSEEEKKEEDDSEDNEKSGSGQTQKALEAQIKVLSHAVAEMDVAHEIDKQDFESARKLLKKATDIPKWRRAWYYYRIDDADEAEKIMSGWAKEKQQEKMVQPLAQLAWLLWQIGKHDEAKVAFTSLRALSMYCDRDLTIFARLAPIAAAANVPEDWRVPVALADDVGVRPDLATLGPFRWQPTPARPWQCSDAEGRAQSLADYKGKPVIVIFYLGAGCLHCTEQLQAFAPKAAAFAEAGIALVGISTESQSELKHSLVKVQPKGGFAFPLFADPTLSIFKAYRAYDDFEQKPLHGTFLIDGKGLVRWQDISFEPFMKPDFLLAEAKRLLRQ